MKPRDRWLRTALGADVIVLVFGWVTPVVGLPLALAGAVSAALVVRNGRSVGHRAGARVLGAATVMCVATILLEQLGVLGAGGSRGSAWALLAIPYLVLGMLLLAAVALGTDRAAAPGSALQPR